jgi:hypothetical protein
VNAEPRRAEAFYAWHDRALQDLEQLASIEGLDRLTLNLRESFGRAPADRAIADFTREVSSARLAGHLAVAPAVGLTVRPSARSTSVRPNTFFGAE